MLDTLPQGDRDGGSAGGVVNPNIGRWRGVGTRRRTENHVVAKSDLVLWPGSNLAVTYARLRPWTLEPRLNVNGSNDRVFPKPAGLIRIAVRDDVEGVSVGGPLRMELRRLERLDSFFR